VVQGAPGRSDADPSGDRPGSDQDWMTEVGKATQEQIQDGARSQSLDELCYIALQSLARSSVDVSGQAYEVVFRTILRRGR
jgi:hypothetical protein